MQGDVRHPHELSDFIGSIIKRKNMVKYGEGHNFEQEAPLGSCLEDIRIEGRASSMKSIMFRRSGETRYGALQNADSPAQTQSHSDKYITP